MGTSNRPFVIGIAGPSCSGKTSIAKIIAAKIAEPVTVLSLDEYYRDLSDLDPDKRDRMNFDHPDAMDYQLLSGHVKDLINGKTIHVPVYDFHTHSRRGEAQAISHAPFIIIEGIFALYWEDIRCRCNLTVFIDLDDEEALARRIGRDMKERGRKREDIIRQYSLTVKPMFEKYVAPTRRHADLTIDGRTSVEHSATMILSRIQQESSG